LIGSGFCAQIKLLKLNTISKIKILIINYFAANTRKKEEGSKVGSLIDKIFF
jgi:hypothetical protein